VLKAKLAKYRTQLLEPTGKKGEKGEGFDVLKSGDARVALIGFPSVGKSTLLSTITTTESEQAAYEFTTLTCIPVSSKIYTLFCRKGERVTTILKFHFPGSYRIQGCEYSAARSSWNY